MGDNMIEENIVQKKLDTKIKAILQRTMQMDLTWDWGTGVAYYGICRYYELTKDEKVLAQLKSRIDELIEIGFVGQWTVNKCAMGHC